MNKTKMNIMKFNRLIIEIIIIIIIIIIITILFYYISSVLMILTSANIYENRAFKLK